MAHKASAGKGAPPAGPGTPGDARATLGDLLARAPGALFVATLDASTDSIAICDPEGTFLFANAAARRWAETGQTGIGSTLDDGTRVWGEWHADGVVVPVEDWPITRALHGEVVQAREMYNRTADGQRHYFLMSASPVRDASGAIVAAVCTAANIDRRKQAEEQSRQLNSALERRVADGTAELERSQRMLNDIVDHTDNPVFLKDHDGRYLVVNRAFESLFGIDRKWLVGRTDFDLFSHDVALVFRANDARALAGDEPLHMEELVPTEDGVRTYLSVKFPLRDGDGRVYGVGGIATDITERKRIEAELAQSQATLSAVIESSVDGIWAVDRDLRVVASNTIAGQQVERLFNLALGDPKIARVVLGDVMRRWQDHMRRALGGERVVVEESLPGDDGLRRYLVSLNPTIHHGQGTGVAVFSRDVTEVHRAEEKARQHQAELAHALRLHTVGEMVASLAHEVNQPLGAIAHYAQGCRRRIESGAITASELLPTVEAIAREAMRAGEITRRLRNILRKEDSHREPVDMTALLESAIGLVLPTATRLRVTLTCVPAPPLPRIVGDPIQIEQVLLNLLLNAAEASSQSPLPAHVEVCMQVTEPDRLEIAVADSGPGVDPTLGDRIFEPFQTTKSGGLGMGLAISRSIVDSHGGQIWVTANPTGGAVFRFTLPVGAAPDGVA